MRFKRWKKMIVMLLITTMLLQSVSVYADGVSLSSVEAPADVTDVADTPDVTDASDTSDTSDVPGISDVADASDTSDTAGDVSEIPDKTDAADTSDVADVPDETDASDVPDIPDETDAPDEADVPDTPDETDVPDTPDETNAPDETDVSDTPDETDAPDETDVSDTPDETDTADVPDAADTTDVPDTPDETEAVNGLDGETGDELSEPVLSNEEVPAEVQAFLDAVAALPSVEAVTVENAEDIGGQVQAVLDQYEGLIDAGLDETEGVAEALEKVYAVYEAVLAAEEIDVDESLLALVNGDGIQGNKVTINPQKHPSDYKGNLEYQYRVFDIYGRPTTTTRTATKPINRIGASAATNKAGTLTKQVGETGFLRRCAYTAFYGSSCGHMIGSYFSAAGYTYIDISYNIDGIAGNEECRVGKWTGNDAMNGSECLETTFEALKPGRTTATRTYYVNFLTSVVGGYCGRCSMITDNQQNFEWHKYTDIFDIIVNADYKLTYNANGGKFDDDTTFKTETKTVALQTASFNLETPTKDGSTFLGWAESADATTATYPAGSPVTLNWSEGYGSKSNPVAKNLYAVWSDTTTLKDLSVTKTPTEEYPIVGEVFTYRILITNPNDRAVTVDIGDTLNEKLDFVSATDSGQYDKATRTVTWSQVTVLKW